MVWPRPYRLAAVSYINNTWQALWSVKLPCSIQAAKSMRNFRRASRCNSSSSVAGDVGQCHPPKFYVPVRPWRLIFDCVFAGCSPTFVSEPFVEIEYATILSSPA